MPGLAAAAAQAPDPLQASVDRGLDARLDRASAAPVALGLSGGGDSLALLHLAADWCARARRPLLALSVDHGLSPESAGWTTRAGRMAAEAGARFQALAWTGPKPEAGLPAAARAARHALLAAAAREAGARVLLLAHTADDLAETEALRAGPAPSIGRLRAWAPSPAWPEGRGVMLLRPLLGVERAALRGWLHMRGLGWIEDPANADPRFARARLRAAGVAPSATPPEPSPGFGEASPDGSVHLPRARLAGGGGDARRSLAAAIACAAGASGTRRGVALDRLIARCAGDQPWTATLGGARLWAEADTLTAGREPGRAPPPDLPLTPGEAAVWDGRFEVAVAGSGWSVGAAAGRLARLTPPDRLRLATLPPPLRGSAPVLVRGDNARLPAPGEARPLGPPRFDAAVGRMRCEPDLAPAPAASPGYVRS